MTHRDVFDVTWQGGGGYGDPLDREIAAVEKDMAAGWVSPEAARKVYGVAIANGKADAKASESLRQDLRARRLGKAPATAKPFKGERIGALAHNLFIARDERGYHVVTRAGHVLCSNGTRWRAGAASRTFEQLPAEHNIVLHERLALTEWYCPSSGTLLAVDVHERGAKPLDDAVLDAGWLESLGRRELAPA
jgi:N-methylhydantoinase B